MGHENGGDVQFVVQGDKPFPEFLSNLGIHGSEGLIEQQHARFGSQRSGDGHALALAARKLVWVAPLQAFQAKQVQQFGYSGFDIRSLPFLDLQAEGDVFEHGHVLEQGVVLEDEPDVALLHGQVINALTANEHVTGGRHFQTGDHAEHGGLAAAAGSEQGHQLALFY